MHRVIHVFGVPSSPLQVSYILTNLGVGHTLVSGVLRSLNTEKHLAKTQPAWPVILPSINAIAKYKCEFDNQVLFVCDALALLSTCNMRLIKPEFMADNIRQALRYSVVHPIAGWRLKQQQPTISDYVSNATKPSFLNDLQSALYRITPYDLRKKVQQLIIGYLAGAESKTKLIAKLETSHKLNILRALVKDPRCIALRNAVALYGKTGDAETTALETGFETFEILYLFNSSRKTLEKK